MKEMTLKEIQNILGYEVKIVADKQSKQLADIPVGETFKKGDMEFIVLEQTGMETYAILKDCWKISIFDDSNNNYVHSKIRRELNTEFYNKLVLAFGKENIVAHCVDLTSLDGRVEKEYYSVMDFASLLTYDMYRNYVKILDKYNFNKCCWLATPYSVDSHGSKSIVCFVNSVGNIDWCSSHYGCAVRPFCIFKSDIFVS